VLSFEVHELVITCTNFTGCGWHDIKVYQQKKLCLFPSTSSPAYQAQWYRPQCPSLHL